MPASLQRVQTSKFTLGHTWMAIGEQPKVDARELGCNWEEHAGALAQSCPQYLLTCPAQAGGIQPLMH